MATTTKRTAKPNIDKTVDPKRLSKIGEMWKKYPKGHLTIVDMKAAMK